MGLDTVELIVTIEKRFDISISNHDASLIDTVGDLQDCVWRELEKAAGTSGTPRRKRADVGNEVIEIMAYCTGLPHTFITREKSITRDLGMD